MWEFLTDLNLTSHLRSMRTFNLHCFLTTADWQVLLLVCYFVPGVKLCSHSSGLCRIMSSWFTGTQLALDLSPLQLLPSAEWIKRISFCMLTWPQWPPPAPSHVLHLPTFLPDVFHFFSLSFFCLQCTPSCGPGYRHRVVLCKSGESGDTLPESKCSKHGRPTSRVRCNLQRCPPPQWVMGPWGEVRCQTLYY